MDNHPVGIFTFDHTAYPFEVDRFKIENITRIVVGRYCFGVTVVHDRFDPHIRQGECGVHTAVIKLDPLSDPIRTTPDDHHLFRIKYVIGFFDIRNRCR